jgi:hypothetical protein
MIKPKEVSLAQEVTLKTPTANGLLENKKVTLENLRFPD